MELAMRDLEGVKPDEIATAPERHTAAPHQFFPETTRLIAPHISTQEDDEDGGLGNDTPYIPRPKVDVATLYRWVGGSDSVGVCTFDLPRSRALWFTLHPA